MKKPKPKTLLKSQVVSFRLTAAQARTLKTLFDNSPPVYVKSPKRMARKIVCDYLSERLVYKNPKHALVDLDVQSGASD